MTEPLEEIEYKGYTIKIYPDEDIEESPRQWDNLGHMACFHRHYALGDDYKDRPDGCQDAHDFMEWMTEHQNEIAIALPLYLYDHGGITIWTDDGIERHHQHYAWDGGQVGYIYVLKSEVKEEYHRKHLSNRLLEQVKQSLITEVHIYDQYLTEDIYGYVIEKDEEEIDSCWNWYPSKPYDLSEIIQETKIIIDNFSIPESV